MPDVSRHHGGLIFKGRNGDETTRRLETSCTKQQAKFGGCNTVLSGLLHAYIACFGICKVTLCSFLLMALSDTWGSRIGMSLKGFRRSCLQVAAAVLPHLLKTNSSSIGGVLHSCCIWWYGIWILVHWLSYFITVHRPALAKHPGSCETQTPYIHSATLT